MCHICGKDLSFQTFQEFKDHVKQELDKQGVPAIEATYDASGNCVICGEAGRCPGWHIGEKKIAGHTEGPWEADHFRREGSTGHWEIHASAKGHQWHVADVYGVIEGEETYGHGFAIANARLISKAPEMLQLLQEAFDAIQGVPWTGCVSMREERGQQVKAKIAALMYEINPELPGRD